MGLLSASNDGKINLNTLQMSSGLARVASCKLGNQKVARTFEQKVDTETGEAYLVPTGNFASIHTTFSSIEGKGNYTENTYLSMDSDKTVDGLRKLGYLFEHAYVPKVDAQGNAIPLEFENLTEKYHSIPLPSPTAVTAPNSDTPLEFKSKSQACEYAQANNLTNVMIEEVKPEGEYPMEDTGLTDEDGNRKMRKIMKYILISVNPEEVQAYAEKLVALINDNIATQDFAFHLEISKNGNASIQKA